AESVAARLSASSPDPPPHRPHPLSLHDALPIFCTVPGAAVSSMRAATFTASPIAVYSIASSEPTSPTTTGPVLMPTRTLKSRPRSEEHTSELQSRENLVCRLLLEKKKNPPRERR